MELRRAVPKVARFCPKKQGDLSRMMRLVPAEGETPARVWAFDGQVGCCIFLDGGQTLPEALVDAAWMTQAVRGAKVKVDVWLTAPGKIVVSVDGADIEGEAKPVSSYPDPPVEVPMKAAPWMDAVPELEGFAAEFDPYSLLSFRKGRVEVTDTSVAVRADLDCPALGLLPTLMFKWWPGNGIAVMGMAGKSEKEIEAVHLRVVDELRVCAPRRAAFPELEAMMPSQLPQPWSTVNRKALLTAFEKAVVASDHGALSLSWDGEGGRVDALGENGTAVSGFPFQVWESNITHGGHGCWVNGKSLVKAFKLFRSERVLMRLSTEGALRLESGPYTVTIWPIRPAGG